MVLLDPLQDTFLQSWLIQVPGGVEDNIGLDVDGVGGHGLGVIVLGETGSVGVGHDVVHLVGKGGVMLVVPMLGFWVGGHWVGHCEGLIVGHGLGGVGGVVWGKDEVNWGKGGDLGPGRLEGYSGR